MASYEGHEAGADHDLVLLFKGFPAEADAAPFLERAGGPNAVHVPDAGFDLTAYGAAAECLPHRRLCFLNSFSKVEAPGWLGLLHAALGNNTNGAAGATASWGSHLSYHLFHLRLPSSYSEVFESRRATRRTMSELAAAADRSTFLYSLWTAKTIAHYLTTGTLFPEMHFRTNGFLIERELFRSLRAGRLRSKEAAYRLESGRTSFTSQLSGLGRPPVIADRNGGVFQAPDWHAADVFWQSEQEDLLVSDNQSRSYASATVGQREVLSRFAWGPRARPA